MFIDEAQETPVAQSRRRDGGVHMTRARVPPRAAPIIGRRPGACQVEPTAQQFAGSRAWSLPLPPQKAAEAAAKPRIELFKAAADVGHPKVPDPAAQERFQVGHRPRQRPAATGSELKP